MLFNNKWILLSNTLNDNPPFLIVENIYYNIDCIIIFSQIAFFFQSSTGAILSEPNKLLSDGR